MIALVEAVVGTHARLPPRACGARLVGATGRGGMRVLAIGVDARDAGVDLVAQPVEVVVVEQPDRDVRATTTRGLDDDVAQSEDPGQQRARDVDGLDAVQRHTPIRRRDEAVSESHGVGVEAVSRAQPHDGQPDGDNHRHAGDPGEDEADVGADEALMAPHVDKGLDGIGSAHPHDGEEDEEDSPRLRQRTQPVDAMPLLLPRRCRRFFHVSHSP
nr:hypothetical protein [Nanchangia anserum]